MGAQKIRSCQGMVDIEHTLTSGWSQWFAHMNGDESCFEERVGGLGGFGLKTTLRYRFPALGHKSRMEDTWYHREACVQAKHGEDVTCLSDEKEIITALSLCGCVS